MSFAFERLSQPHPAVGRNMKRCVFTCTTVIGVILSSASHAANQPTAAHALSPMGMFMAADLVVKSVMVSLALASLTTWTIFIAKSVEIVRARRAVRSALASISGAPSLAAACDQTRERTIGRRLVLAAVEEWRASELALEKSGLKERVDSRLERLVLGLGRSLAAGTGVLASVGSLAPFIGLFGTVWGIMNSFIGITKAQTTNLAVVEPGIAEALLATAIGLLAAIPAVLFYNYFARSISGYRALLGDLRAEIMRITSRDLDRLSLRQNRTQEAPHGRPA